MAPTLYLKVIAFAVFQLYKFMRGLSAKAFLNG